MSRKGKGEGRIFRRKWNGRELPTWHVAYWGPKNDGGWGEIRETTRTDDFNGAKRFLRRRLSEVDSHTSGARRFIGPNADRLTISELLEAVISDREVRGLASARTTRPAAAHVRRLLGQARVASVNRARVNEYVKTRLKEGAAPATIDHETETLGRAFNIAFEDGRLAFKPKMPRLVRMHENARQGFVELGDFERHNAELPTQVLRDLARFAYATGMRKGEILKLKWDGWDRETRMLRLHARDAKSRRGRAIAVDGWPELSAIIDRRNEERSLGCEFIFQWKGERIRDFSHAWEGACARSGVEFIFHDLRRTAIRNNIRAGVPENVCMMISGHRSRTTLDRYNITSDADLADAMIKRSAYESTLPRVSEPSKVLGFPGTSTVQNGDKS